MPKAGQITTPWVQSSAPHRPWAFGIASGKNALPAQTPTPPVGTGPRAGAVGTGYTRSEPNGLGWHPPKPISAKAVEFAGAFSMTKPNCPLPTTGAPNVSNSSVGQFAHGGALQL